MCAPAMKESLRHRYAMPPPFRQGRLALRVLGYPSFVIFGVTFAKGKAFFHPSVCFADTSPNRGGFYGTSGTTFPTVNLQPGG